MSHLDLHYALGEAGYRWMNVSSSAIGPIDEQDTEHVDRTLVFLQEGWGFSIISFPDDFDGYKGMLIRPDGELFGKQLEGPDDDEFEFPSVLQAIQSLKLIAHFLKQAL